MAYYAVFDGHGGTEAAKYSAIHLHSLLGHQLNAKLSPHEALREAFHQTDRMFVERSNREVSSSLTLKKLKSFLSHTGP